MAATALGLTTAQAYRYVAVAKWRSALSCQTLTSEFLSTIKNTSGGDHHRPDRVDGGGACDAEEFSFQVFEAFTAATILYLLVNIVVVIAMRLLERGVAIPGYITGK